MRTTLMIIAAVSIFLAGTMAFAHGPGKWGGGHMGPGYGNHMMGGYGGHMMGPGYARGGGPDIKADREFLDQTADLRKALHEKKFEYREAARKPGTTDTELKKIEKEIFDLQTKIREKSPRMAYGGYGPCWGR